MKITKINTKQANELKQPFLTSADKKRLGVTGYKNISVFGWYFQKETEKAILFTGIQDIGDYYNRSKEEVKLWLPKSQLLVFEYIDDELIFDGYTTEEAKTKIFFVKTWLYNKKRNDIELTHFKNSAL